ncbi:MAG TPA: mechanosensitive ion channel domain-containing protein [Solirubrobacteraceae bacterium]|jgi:small-conductance mechanosensitive channel|nr:mechanosensitive ion channel domain-containing protein [Solirubrobacteraceae bacterium]
MIPLATSVLGQAGQDLGAFIPRLGGAIALLLIGLLLTRLIARLLLRAMQAAGLDRLADHGGVTSVLQASGLGGSLAGVIARAIRIFLTIVVVFAALSLLGLQFLSVSLNQAILELPRLFIAAALVLAGAVVAGAARQRTDRLTYQLDFPVPLGQIVQVSILAIFAIIAAAEIGISTELLLILIGVLVAAVAGTFTLAFGLGSRDVARALSAGRYLRHDYRVGQEIGFGDVRGRITRIQSTGTMLDAGEGRSIRVPNHMLIESVVTIYADDRGLDDGPS